MRPALVVAIAVLLPSSAVLAETCSRCALPDKLCETHAERDKEAVKRLREGLGKADPAVRQAALDAFAVNCREHDNVRMPGNAQMVAVALRDPDPATRVLAARLLGEQHRPTAAKLLEKEVDGLLKKLAKEPKPIKREEDAWLADLDLMSAVCGALGELGVPECGPAMAKILTSTRIKVLNVAGKNLHTIRSKEIPPALIETIDRIRLTPSSSAGRDECWVTLTQAWEKLTSSGVQLSASGSPADAIRYVQELKDWWKSHEKQWK